MNKKNLFLLNKVPGWLSFHEGQFLAKSARLIQKLKGEVVEIGSYQGKSTVWLAQEAEKVYAIDPHQGKLTQKKVSPTLKAFRFHLKKAKVDQKVIPIVKTSAQAAKSWHKKIKLLFIDGLHDEKNARRDFRLWSPFLINNSIVAMHDSFCGWPGAGQVALEKIVRSNKFYEVGVVGSIIYGIKGAKNWLTKLNHYRCRLLIELAIKINGQKKLSSSLSFLIIHRLIKLLLINRFTLKRR